MKDDLISKTAAIKTAERMYKRCDTSSVEDYHDLMVDALTELPSAQLAQDLPKCCTDTISRAAVGDALNRIEISRNASWYEFYQKALTAVGTLPSAQPDVSDTNQSRGEVTVYANR